MPHRRNAAREVGVDNGCGLVVQRPWQPGRLPVAIAVATIFKYLLNSGNFQSCLGIAVCLFGIALDLRLLRLQFRHFSAPREVLHHILREVERHLLPFGVGLGNIVGGIATAPAARRKAA